MSGRRLTRKEIVQEDQIHSTINQVFSFLVENRNLLIAALVGAIVLAAAIYYWVGHQAGVRAEYQASFAAAQKIFNAAVGEAPPQDPGTPPDTRPRFKTTEEKYAAALKAFSAMREEASGTPFEQYARYYEALCQRELGKRDEYLKLMQGVSTITHPAELATLALYSLGDDALATSDHAKALEYFEKILKDSNTTFPREQILMQMGEYFEKRNDKAQAKVYFERVIKEFPDTQSARQAQPRVGETPKPAAPPAGPTPPAAK